MALNACNEVRNCGKLSVLISITSMMPDVCHFNDVTWMPPSLTINDSTSCLYTNSRL